MTQYIDKSKLLEEIKKRANEYPCDNSEQDIGYHCALCEIQDFLNTLEVKEVDLEKEFYDFLDLLIGKDNGHLAEDELFSIAKYFFNLGLKTAHKGE